MTSPINYLSKEKALLYLKMGRPVAMFAGVGEFFESLTFDWIKLEKTGPAVYRCTLVRSFPEGDEYSPWVQEFRTLNGLTEEYDAATNPFIEDSLEACLKWITTAREMEEEQRFISPEELNKIYAALYSSGKLSR